MPIDPKVSVEKSIATTFCQSNSFHSFHSKSSLNPNLVASKSSNCLTDVLVEDEELIDKLFPKCRPKSKPSSASSSKSDRTNGCLKKTLLGEQTLLGDCEMLNVPSNHSLSAISNGETNGSNTGEECRKRNSHPQSLSLQSRRLWNFMDISPSPSPPPLSPVEDTPSICSHKYAIDSAGRHVMHDKLPLYTPTQERLSPVGQHECFDLDQRELFQMKGRFDINSLEVNRSDQEPQAEEVNMKANQSNCRIIYSKSDYCSPNDGTEKKNINHRHSGAHFRLDSLLLSPDEQREFYKASRLPNGIKKSNKFSLEYDLNDEDDVLFSRINTVGNSTSLLSRKSSKSSQVKSTECINSFNQFVPMDKSQDPPSETQLMSSGKREDSLESVKSKSSKLPEDKEDVHVSKGTTGNSGNVEEISLSDKEEEERTGKSQSEVASRNRIELAGGKELFSSSRSIRAKRRATCQTGSQSGQSRVVPSESHRIRTSALSRHTLLYSLANECEQVAEHNTDSCSAAAPHNTTTTTITSNNNNNNNKLAKEESSCSVATVAQPADSNINGRPPTAQTQTQIQATLAVHSQVATGNDGSLVRAEITAPSSTEQQNLPDTNLPRKVSAADNSLEQEKPVSRRQSFFDVCEAKANESRQWGPSIVRENVVNCVEKCTELHKESAPDTLSSRRKSMMILEDESDSSKMSLRDNIASKRELTISSNASEDLLHYPRLACIESKLEDSLQNVSQTKEMRPLNNMQEPEINLCHQIEQSVTLSCDQFAQDLRKRLDIVSNTNYVTDSCEGESFGLKATELDSDNNSVKSVSLSQKSSETNERIARIIGSVPIAQYEGSPKRYGPKPGYPKRVLSTSSNNSNDYETIAPKKSDAAPGDAIGHKSAVLSSENGSPHSSTSSTSSGTFSSTDIHSSSSFSCPFNQKSNGFSNWNIRSRVKDNFDDPLSSFADHDKSSYGENTLKAKVEPVLKPQVSCDEIVKSILSIPSGQIDTEDDVDEVTSSSDKLIDGIMHDMLHDCESNRMANEPIYSSIASNAYSADANKSSGYSSKRSLHSDDSESVTKSKTSISSNGCDRNITRSPTSVKTQQGDIPTRGPLELGNLSSSQLIGEQRNAAKSVRAEHYPKHLQTSQSFESTDSSYRSEKYASKGFYDDDEDGFVFHQKNYPTKQVPMNGIRMNGNSTDGANLLDPLKGGQITQLSYTCLSPELSSHDLQSQAKLYPDSTYESARYPSDQCDAYSDNVANEKSNSANVPTARIGTMPVLEDGLSSGIPSSDELEYDEDEDGEDELMTNEHDLDDYVDEYNRRSGPCDSMLSSQFLNRLELGNGPNSNGTNYSFHYKQQAQHDYGRTNKIAGQAPQPLYRCATKVGAPFGLELNEDISHHSLIGKKDTHDYFNGHHHHMNHHVHNHPVLEDNSRANLSSPYENGKNLPNTTATDYNHDKFCISSQLRSISNSSSNNSSMSTVRNAPCQLNASGPTKCASPPAGAGSHHHYHHYYHSHHGGSSLPQQSVSSRQNYPNLSSSPTSLSPNSPGGMQNQSSGSSSSSTSQPASSAPHHYHQTQAHPSQTSSQSQEMVAGNSPSSSLGGVAATNVRHHHDEDCDTDQETDRLLGSQRNDDRGYYDDKVRVHAFESAQLKRSSTSREAFSPKVLIEGVLFRARYLGSTQLVCDGQPTKATRMMQAEEAVSRIKAPEGETQPSTEVDLFISTEKIMVLNTDLKEIMMDHALRTISYIADIGDLLVLMARRRTPLDDPNESGIKRIPKMICHVFESDEAQYIAQSIGQAFQMAYMEFLKANGIEDSSFLKEMDYQEVLNSQEIFGNELEMFAKREKQKEVIVPKQKGEILGIVIVESGWGSMLPTVVIANMAQSSPSARCGQLNIGDQIIAINGISLVGLPLSTCQAYVKNTKNQTAVKFTIVPCAPVVEVKIKRPDTKYQLGFSVQNGVICSLLRGGIAERGGVRVGHRIIEINGQSVVAVPHDKIVNLLATSVGEIHMKTMPTSMFRLLTGQDSPSYM